MELSAIERPHKVEFIGQQTDRPITDITDHVISIDKFTDSGAGEIPSSQIVFNTDFGRFINSGIKFDQFDEFRIKVTSPYDGNDTFERVMFLDEIMPQTAEGGGYITAVQMYAREWYMTKVKMTGHHYFITYRDMVKKIIDTFNSKKGKRVPLVIISEDTLNNIPPYTAGIFDFGYETSCYKALLQVLARLARPVSGGGAGDFFDMRFKDVSGVDTLECEIFSYGSRTKANVTTILRGKNIDTQYISETKQNQKGTILIARGRAETGRYPKEVGLWTGVIEELNNAPEWESDVTYPKDSLVRRDDIPYVAKRESTGRDPNRNAFHWEDGAVDRLDFDYSPWTNGLAEHYANLGSNLSGRMMHIPDSNLVIKDGKNYRNWVDFRVNSESDIPSQFKLDNKIIEDTRVLVDSQLGTPSGAFAGNDAFDNAYKDAFVQYRNDSWTVIHTPEHKHECAVLYEGRVYVFGVDYSTIPDGEGGLSYSISVGHYSEKDLEGLGFQWEVMDKYFLGNDCFHKATAITHDTETDHEQQKNRELANVTIHGSPIRQSGPSAIRVEYNFDGVPESQLYNGNMDLIFPEWYNWIDNRADNVGLAISGLEFLAHDSAFQYGWWDVLFYAPFPRKASGSDLVGDVFKQPVLDLKNLNYTSGGNEGWGHEDSEDLGQITGITFLMKFQYTLTGSPQNVPLVGNLPFRVTMYDTEDNVWVADFVYRFLGDTQQVNIPISAFRIYRARNPVAISVDDAIHNVLNPELKVLEIFETRKIKMITLQWQASYDPMGRYSPANANRYLLNLGSSLIGQHPKFVGWHDAFGFIKAPISQAGLYSGNRPITIDRHVMPNIKDYPLVTNQSQLDKIAEAELDLAEFRVEDYVVKTTGKCDLRAGDRVYLEDSDIIPYTVKSLSVRKVNYTVNASDGPSGFVRHVTIQARLNQP